MLVVSLALVGGCARFPATTANNQFTRVTFSARLAGPVNPNYLYYFAIYSSQATQPNFSDNTTGPEPVVGIGSPNGFVTGHCTHYVAYNPAGGSQPYTVFRVGHPDDPQNDNVPVAYPVSFIDPRSTGSGGQYGDTLSFTITTRDVADSDSQAQTTKAFFVNVLTMNKLALGSVSGRIYDAFGDQRIPNQAATTLTVRVDSSQTYSNQTGLGSGIEPVPPSTNPNDTDCPDPSLDLIDYSIVVQTP